MITFILSTLFFTLFMYYSKSVILAGVFYSLFAFTAYTQFPVLLGYVGGRVVPQGGQHHLQLNGLGGRRADGWRRSWNCLHLPHG
ncbi:hypothetical protein [Thermogymnomonas acidicola]|uniref:hypothetical protein n=1 Tax=Thermogymnomonas acidicola TaxID=399579 RepID=UPI0009462589|nr:hypothetical protein [Thermogymnomonas acidicola]